MQSLDIGQQSVQYDRWTVRYLLGPWAPELVTAAGVGEGDRVLDVACGTGAVTRVAAGAAGLSGMVTGLDLRHQSLAVARNHPEPVNHRIRWVEGNACDLPFGGNRFDVLVCQQGAQFFPDRLRALREMNRVLRAGRRLGITVWREVEHNPYYLALIEALEEVCGIESREKMMSSFSLSDASALGSLVEAAGFRDVRVTRRRMMVDLPPLLEFVPQHLRGTSVAQHVAALDPTAAARLCSRVSGALSAYEDDGGARIPLEVYIATAVAA